MALIFFGAAMGVLVAVAYCVCLGRTGRLRPRPLAMLVAGGGFLAIYLVPFVKYPADPPAIGHAETIRQRGLLYLLMVGTSVVLLILAVWLGRRLRSRFGNWNASLLAGGAFIVAVGIVVAALPPLGHLAANHSYGNHLTETPQPLTNHKATLQLRRVTDGDRTYAEWTASFDAAPEEADKLAEGMGANVFQGGFNALKSHFAGQS